LPGEGPPRGQLPQDTRPIGYRLELSIDPTTPRFSGRVAIEVELDRPRRVLWLHAQDLDVSEVSVRLADGGPIGARFEAVDDTGVAAVRLDQPAGPGRVQLVVRWEAAFAAGLRGLYRVEREGAAYAFSQLEPIDARRVFPGFDEPAFKVPFEVTLVVPDDVVALTNTLEVESTPLEGGRVRRRYARTPPLPTYLLAWAVGPFDVVDAPPIPPNAFRDRPVPLRGIAPRGRGSELAFALRETPPILEWIEEYAGSGYPFSKLDLVAVPDFSAGAMENVGLVTFRDRLLLIDPETASVHSERAFANVMAHELAHMWFGNQVTMPWWDDIWLNEAFATWLAAKTVTATFPAHRSDLSQLQATHRVMNADALASARSIRQPITSNHDIRSAFDGITYQKGAAVLAMFEAAIGERAFRDTLRRYLSRHAQATATSADLLAVVAEMNGERYAAAMRTFLDQPGLPLLAFETACSTPESGSKISERGRFVVEVEQSRYRPLGSSIRTGGDWQVPVCLAGQACRLLAAPRDGEEQSACPPWLHPNPDARGYYRWTLSPEALDRLVESGWSSLSERERMSVVDALQAGYRSGDIGMAQVIALSGQLAEDPSRPVATAPLGWLRELRDRIAVSDAQRLRAEERLLSLYRSQAVALGFDDVEGESGERRLRRSQVVGAVVGVGRDPVLRAEARQRGDRYLAGPPGQPDASASAAELLGVVSVVAVEEGGAAPFDAAWEHLFATEDAVVRGRMLRALAAARDPERRERARALVFDARLRMNERLRVVSAQARAADSDEEREEVFAWVRDRADAIVEVLSPAQGAGMLTAASGFCSRDAATVVKEWFAERAPAYPGGPRRLEGLVERIQLCAARVEHQRPSALSLLDGEAGG
jgi:alanyl aminopeptidase